MPGQKQLIPICPLNVVLFPQVALTLHVFEERYKEMVGIVINDESASGIVCTQGEIFAKIRCTTRIVKVIKSYDDRHMDIMSVGSNRFMINKIVTGKAYLREQMGCFSDKKQPMSVS